MNTLICSKRRIDIENATHYGILEKGAERFFKVMVNFIETA